MNEFSRDDFEQTMARAAGLHRQGYHEAALRERLQAFDSTPDGSLERGRAARDAAASYDRLGNPLEAHRWAITAFNTHNDLVMQEQPPSVVALRERSASAMYVGAIGLRSAIVDGLGENRAGEAETLSYVRCAWDDIRQVMTRRSSRLPDQYAINAAGRVSIAESLIGSKKAGLGIGARAVLWSFLSESPRLETANLSLTPKERLRAKTRAFTRGVAAMGVGLLASVATTDSGRQRVAQVANKIV